MPDWTFARCSERDTAECVDVLNRHFGLITPEYYRWHVHGSPHGKGLALLARSGARSGDLQGGGLTQSGVKTVAHQSIVRRDLILSSSAPGKSERISAGQSSYLVVAPEFRGRGLFPRISAECFSWAEEEGLDAVFFFQAGDVRSLPWYRRMGCLDLGVIPVYSRYLTPSKLAERRWGPAAGALTRVGDLAWRFASPIVDTGVRLAPIDRFTETACRVATSHVATSFEGTSFEATSCVESTRPFTQTDKSISMFRDAAYLQYRYLEDPLRRYTAMGAFRDEVMLGYVVVTADRMQGDKMYIADIGADSDSAQEVLSATLLWARKKGASAMHMWGTMDAGTLDAMRQTGFRQRSGVHGHMLLWISARRPDLREYRMEDWRIALGDSDLY